MSSNHNVDLASAHPFQNLFLLFLGAKAGEHLDEDRVGFQSLHKCLIVLLGKHSGGHQDGYLQAIHGCLEGGTQCDFGFAVADITTDQTVHRLGLLHIPLHLFDGA